jgi:hypothetical protein
MRFLQNTAQPFAPRILPFTAKAAHSPEIASKIRLFQSYYKLHEMQGLGKLWEGSRLTWTQFGDTLYLRLIQSYMIWGLEGPKN